MHIKVNRVQIDFFFFLVLHICLVTFIWFISNTEVHLFISCTKVQLIHSVIHFYLLHFTYHSLSHSHLPYLVLLTLHRIHRIPNSLHLLLFNQSRLWKPGLSLDKILIQNIYCIISSWTRMLLLLFLTSK